MNARKEDFVYDHLNRLKSAKTYLNGGTTASRTLATTYDKLGNIDTKTSTVTADVGVTGYGFGSGTTAPGHHAVTSASIGGNAHTFSYDAEGNMTQYDCTPATCEDKYIGWNKRNLPTTVTLGDSLTDTTPTAKDEFAYGPNGQRYYKKSTWDDAGTLRTEHTYYVGRFEEVLPGDQPDYSSIMKTRVTDSLLHVRTMATVSGTVVSAMEYLHRDHLGSVEAVTDAGGASLLVQAYDPFGERRKSDWMGMLSASERQTQADNQPLKTSRGYTGHEHLDRTGFIHMNGRLYDPQLGRFLSPDPIVAAPGSSQSWNSYSYVSNSPLSFVDPGGQFQAGIGCNVGYVMCMNGGNTSGGGGGSSQGTETVPIRTFNFHIGVIFARVPVLRDPIGSIIGRGGGINDDPNGGINSDLYFGGLPSFRLIFNFFISITSNTETRQIQTTEEEQSPASRPMGVGAQNEPSAKGKWRALTTDEINLAESVFRDSIDYSQVRIYNKKFFLFQPKNVAMAPNGNIYFHPKGGLYSDNFADTNLKGLFIHEMTHVWQYQQGVNVALKAMFNRTYSYTLTPGKPLTSYGIEQQGAIVRDYYRLQNDSASGPMIELYKQAIPFVQ